MRGVFGAFVVCVALVVLAHAEYASEQRFRMMQSLDSSNWAASADFDFIDNGVLKVGARRDAGGSIGYLSESKGTYNVVNMHDKGREVQQSYYADPQNYRPDVCGLVTPWKQVWPWNPIGAGDVYGNAGKIISWNKTSPSSLTVTSTPLQWACKNISCECEFETQYTLEGTALHVIATLRNHRTDGGETKAHDQEIPAVYTIADLPALYTYKGNAPWTNDTMYKFPTTGGPPWVPGGFQATESWAAFTREDGSYGLGVYTPSTTRFLGGFHGEHGHGGPLDDATGYIAPLGEQVLPATTTYVYEYYLILGTLDTIREFVVEHHKSSTA